MAYCSKCGTLNSEDANVCVKCGAPLQAAPTEAPYWRHRRYDREHRPYHHGSGFGALIFGVIIIVIGLTFLLSEVYGVAFSWTYIWATILIIVGIWLLSRALMWRRRK